MHSAFGPLFAPDLPAVTRERILSVIARRMGQLEAELDAGTDGYMLPTGFTQADALIAVILSWAPHVNVDISAYPKAYALHERVFARPATLKALKTEGLA